MRKLIGICMLIVSLFAIDYTSMSLDELSSIRNSVSSEDRDAFRSAFQDKAQYLTPEERMAYSSGKGQGSGNGQMIQERTQQRLRDGSGSGGMYQGSRSGGSFGGASRGGGRR